MESRRITFNCSKCSYSTKRSYNLKRHLENEHTADRTLGIPNKTSDGLPKRRRIHETDEGLHTKKSTRKLGILQMGQDNWEMDCLDANRNRNQKMACIPKKSLRKPWILYELGFLQ